VAAPLGCERQQHTLTHHGWAEHGVNVDVVNELAYAIDDSHLPTAADLDEP